MKVKFFYKGPVVGSEVEEVIDTDEWNLDPKDERDMNEAVSDWAANFHEMGWSPVEDNNDPS